MCQVATDALRSTPSSRHFEEKCGDAKEVRCVLQVPDARTRAAEQLAMICEGERNSLVAVAKLVFGSGRSALATLCGMPQVDCSAGVAVHGMSLGGLLATVAPSSTSMPSGNDK